MRRTSLSDRGVAALRPRAVRYAYADPEVRGVFIRIQPSGSKSFYAVTLAPGGRQVWTKVGDHPTMPIAEARRRAAAILVRIRDGMPATEPTPDSFGDVAANWFRRHVEANGLRSAAQIRRILDTHVLPKWRDRPMASLKRSDIVSLLDHVEDNHGKRAADLTAAWVQAACNWYAARHDSFVSPFVRGMRRDNPTARARTRILDDAELRAVWAAADGTFGAFIKLALLTGQRSTKIRTMKWDDLDLEAGVWRIRTEKREKANAGTLRLPAAAMAIIKALPRAGAFVFQGRADNPVDLYSKSYREFLAKLPAGMPAFVIHDLRRTSRSLMSRAGIEHNVAERVLGHRVGTVVSATYDRHKFEKEMGAALASLATLIGAIVDPQPNVNPAEAEER